MDQPIRINPEDTNQNESSSTSQRSSYKAPEIFEIDKTVNLIKGAQWRGPQDWPGSWYIYELPE